MDARLGRVARAERLRAGLELIDVAHEAGVSEATLSRFETGRGWRRETNAIVDAYARLCDLQAEDLWLAAVAASDP